MRFVLVGPVYPYRGGIAHYTTRLYQTLYERGHAALLVSFKRQYPQRLFPGRSDRDPSQEILKVPGAKYWIDSLNPFTWFVTSWRIYRYEPDVVILQWWTTFWAPVWLVLGVLQRLLVRKRLLVICHNVLPHETRWWDAVLARSVLRWASAFTVQSLEEERRLHSLLPRAQTTIVPLPVFDMFVEQRVSREEARKLLGLPLDAPVLLFFGIVREYKGLQDVLAALPKVQARAERVLLVVAGEFWDDKQPYLDMIERLGIGQAVLIQDRYIPNEEAALYFSAADALVAPYRAKTGSGVIQMAKGFGLAIITTRVGGWSELTAEREAGLLAAPGDPGSLAEAICRYIESGMSSVEQAATGATAQDSWDRMVCAIEALAENG